MSVSCSDCNSISSPYAQQLYRKKLDNLTADVNAQTNGLPANTNTLPVSAIKQTEKTDPTRLLDIFV